LARPKHWIKNAVVFIPVVFAKRTGDIEAWAQAGMAALAFCFASAFAYIVNDIKDRRSDLAHPLKKDRPLASGKVALKTALIEAALFLILALIVAQSLSTVMLLMAAVFIALQVSYSLFIKEKALMDVIAIALGFVIRAGAGVAAIKGEVSPWLFICMFTLCLFMGFCKRYNEVVTIEDAANVRNHRPTLIAYTPELLTHLITLSAGIAVISFLLYGLSESTINRFGSIYFVYTLPIVVYGVFRFAMLSMKGSYADPTDIFFSDRPFQATAVVWVAAAFGIIYYGENLGDWLQSLY
jgi:4-hydroxybenzoate polyprenyltransferase